MTNKSFENTIYRDGIISSIPNALVVFIISVFYVRMQLHQLPWAIISILVAIIVGEFVLSPLCHRFITRKLSDHIQKWTDRRIISARERTQLIEALAKYPIKKQILTFCLFIIISLCVCLSYHYISLIGIDLNTTIVAFVSCLFGSYNAGMKAYSNAEKICDDLALEIYKDGIDKDYIYKKKHFGLSTGKRCILFLVIPVTMSNLMILLVFLQTYKVVNGSIPTPTEQMIRVACISAICVFICIYMTVLYFKQIKESNKKLQTTISNVFSEDNAQKTNECTLTDEMQYNIFLLNNIVERYKNLIKKATEIGDKLQHNTGELSILSQEFAATSITQNKVVQDVKETAEVQKNISLGIQDKMYTVSEGIEKTSIDVENSLKTLDDSISQMKSIENENTLNMQRIKNLSHQIDNIDDILIMIKEIADQTRIIAFNAELEAVSAKEEGKNFHIVATEIRRLANSTMNSIHEIQSNIENIQQASLSLIKSSENVTSYIQEENNITHELEDHFMNIKTSAESTNNKSIEIREIIEQQTSAFEAITVTLGQISEGFKQFTVSTKSISDTASKMEENASVLSSLNQKKQNQ